MITVGDKVRIKRVSDFDFNCSDWVEKNLLPVLGEYKISQKAPEKNAIGEVICSGLNIIEEKSYLYFGVLIGNKVYIMKSNGIIKF